MEVANLSVKLSADVEQAISGLHKTDAAVTKSATVAGKESKKIEGFMGKWKAGWIMMAAAAIASLYAVAKSSAVIGGYFREFGLLLGYFFDSIGEAMAPIIEPLLDWLWDLADAFDELPDFVKIATGAVIGLAAAIPTLLVGLAALKWALTTLGITAGVTNAAMIALGVTLGLGVGIASVWVLAKTGVLDALNEMGRKFEEMHPIIMDFLKAMGILPGSLGVIAIDIVTGEFGRIPEDLKRVWEEGGKAVINIWKWITDTISNMITLRYNQWMEWGHELKRGMAIIWNAIGNAIWKPIQRAYNRIVEYVNKIISKIKSIPVVGSVASYASRHIPSFQHGGYVPTTGLAMLHAGEHVTPAGGATTTNRKTVVNFNPTIYVTGEMRTDTDLRDLANKLSGFWKDDLKRMRGG